MDQKEENTPPLSPWPPSGMLECPKDDCPRLFTSREVLESHQMSYVDHAFCTACNIQFDTHEEMFLHQLVSKRHHNCPVCNRSFKTDDARDYHIQKEHPEDRDLICPGCRMTFTSSESYHSHIISNACRSTAVLALNEHNARRARMEVGLREASQPGPRLSFCSDDDNYRDTGTDSESLSLPRPRQFARQYSGASDESTQPNESTCPDGGSSPGVSSNFPMTRSSPRLSPARPLGLYKKFTYLIPSERPKRTPFPNVAVHPDDLIGWDPNLYVGPWPPSLEIFRTPERKQPATPPIHKVIPEWDSEEHWNSETKRYFCDCGFTTPFVKIYEQHVVMERSASEHQYHCTHCGKGFPSVPNLFTHIEVAHPDPTFQGQENRRSGQVLRNGSSAERRLDMDGPMDIGELEFQVYDRPPTFAQNTPRYRAKGDYGLRSTKVPHGTYW
ncbi:unnamed protein product [Penicillium manginii]